jgi:diguanylate cyclase (GGDEF)-like protein
MPNNGEKVITISMGVALARPTDTPESLYKRADELLYEAKNSGRNRVVMEKA